MAPSPSKVSREHGAGFYGTAAPWTAKHPDVAPLRGLCKVLADKLSDDIIQYIDAGIKKLSDQNGVLQFGTGCSGSECPSLVMKCAGDILAEKGISLDAKTVLTAEIHPTKRDFIYRAFGDEIEVMLADVNDLKSKKILNGISQFKKFEKNRRCRVLVIGTSCKGFSKCSTKKRDHKGCVKSGKGSSGNTWRALLDLLDSPYAPDIVIIENVPDMDDEDDEGNSDLKIGLQQLKRRNKKPVVMDLNPEQFGIAHRRRRLWLVAAPDDWTDEELNFIPDVVAMMETPVAQGLPLEKILLPDDHDSHKSLPARPPAVSHVLSTVIWPDRGGYGVNKYICWYESV